MAHQNEPKSGWASYELVWLDAAGDVADAPFSAALGNALEAIKALKRISRVEDIGWPDAKKLQYGKKGKKRIVKKDDFIYLLKCHPDCWRLYFYVREKDKHFIYVHAVCKRTDAENPGDAVTARKRYDKRTAGGRLKRIGFPT